MSKAWEGSEQIWRISSGWEGWVLSTIWEVIEYSIRRLSCSEYSEYRMRMISTGWKGLVHGWEGSPYRMRMISSYPSWSS